MELGEEERSYPQPGVHPEEAKAGFRGAARPLARRLSGSGGGEGGRACERPHGGGDALSRVGSCSKGQTKGTMGSAAGLLGSLRLAAEPPAWEGRGKWLGWPQRARFPSAPTQALGAAGTPGHQRTEGRTASQAMVIARRAARCLRPAATGLSGVRLPGSRLKQVPLRGKCCPRSQNTSPKCLGPCQSLVSSGCAPSPWLAGTLLGGGCCSTSLLL